MLGDGAFNHVVTSSLTRRQQTLTAAEQAVLRTAFFELDNPRKPMWMMAGFIAGFRGHHRFLSACLLAHVAVEISWGLRFHRPTDRAIADLVTLSSDLVSVVEHIPTTLDVFDHRPASTILANIGSMERYQHRYRPHPEVLRSWIVDAGTVLLSCDSAYLKLYWFTRIAMIRAGVYWRTRERLG